MANSPSIRQENGIPTIFVEGQPFHVFGAQCDVWRSTRQDEKTREFFDAYQEMNASTVGICVPWSYIEREKDIYHFSFLHWFIDEATRRGLKLMLQLFNTNICGKVMEVSSDSGIYPQYTPDYMLEQPDHYQRMVLPRSFTYGAGGPPMCPNDPNTLDREVKYVRMLAEHIRQHDGAHTVIGLQINNEYYYQQWQQDRPEVPYRCTCKHCNQKYTPELYPSYPLQIPENAAFNGSSEEVFMFQSFADYTKALTNAISEVYDLPLYVNSPWWEPYIIPMFLDACPNLDFVGIDGVLSPHEPNWLTTGQLGRNIAFAAECPTENPRTRDNLKYIPYYVLVKHNGIGHLLWEAPEPHTVVHDPAARTSYGKALYPLKHAMVPILKSRGTESFHGWYAIRETFEVWEERDVFGNIQRLNEPNIQNLDEFVVRQGNTVVTVRDTHIVFRVGKLTLELTDTDAGVVIGHSPSEVVIATTQALVNIDCSYPIVAHAGRFHGDTWFEEKQLNFDQCAQSYCLEILEPQVIKVNVVDPPDSYR